MLTNSALGRSVEVAALDAALANYSGLAFLSGKVGIIQAMSADPRTPTVSLPPEQLAEYAGRFATPLQALDFTTTESGMRSDPRCSSRRPTSGNRISRRPTRRVTRRLRR